MRSIARKASAAGFVLCAVLALGPLGSSSAFGADDTSGLTVFQMPADVIEQASAEALITESYTIVDPRAAEAAADDEESTESQIKASSLYALAAGLSGISPRHDEEDCLARATYFESQGESLEGKLAVAQVIVNRARSGRFPSSICGVVKQPGQFSFVRGGQIPRVDASRAAWRDSKAAARIAMDGLWPSRVGKALFFHATHVSPGWRLTRVATVGNHVFYR